MSLSAYDVCEQNADKRYLPNVIDVCAYIHVMTDCLKSSKNLVLFGPRSSESVCIGIFKKSQKGPKTDGKNLLNHQ